VGGLQRQRHQHARLHLRGVAAVSLHGCQARSSTHSQACLSACLWPAPHRTLMAACLLLVHPVQRMR
jgi:hypothetical protein